MVKRGVWSENSVDQKRKTRRWVRFETSWRRRPSEGVVMGSPFHPSSDGISKEHRA